MASQAAAPAEFTQMDAARQSLIAISQSPPKTGAPIRSPDSGMAGVHDGETEDDKYRTKLISISNQSPDAARPPPRPAKNAAA